MVTPTRTTRAEPEIQPPSHRPVEVTTPAVSQEIPAANAGTTRFWLADPALELRLYRAGSMKPLQFRNGILVVEHEHDAETIRANLRGQVFEEDWPADRAAPICQICGYAPRSFDAWDAHQRTHPVIR